ncbi:MAG: hypothetical protein Q8K11_10665 [Phenylobacterium sp.]|uniref:hypothetical protein n=1 Tax=Phenylobacterium sp. TaxID=1871053 RepID=UPI002730C42B|nr:hypothetical protein [Phenylobacterium sp.]MDP2010630.1 hypothetical protein [Phenylobacterium sp.]
MNAHVTKRDGIAREVPSPLAGACPAEQLGREIQRIHAEIAGLEDVLEGDQSAAWNELLVHQLFDRAKALRTQLQWAKATTLAGVYAQTCEIRYLAEFHQAPDPDGSRSRAICRLHALVDRSIRDLGGFKAFELGGLTNVQSPDDFADVLARYTGQDVRETS